MLTHNMDPRDCLVPKLGGILGGLAIGGGLSLASSLFGGKKKEKAGEKAYGMDIETMERWQDKYAALFKKYARWGDKERKQYMKAMSGVFSQRASALKREGAKYAAGRGTSGGAYGREAARIERERFSNVAAALGPTYGPKGLPSPAPFTGAPGAPSYSASGEALQGAGELGGKITSMYAMDKWGSKLFPNLMKNPQTNVWAATGLG